MGDMHPCPHLSMATPLEIPVMKMDIAMNIENYCLQK